MTRLLEQAVEAVSALPDEAQDDLARILLQFAGVDQPPYELTPGKPILMLRWAKLGAASSHQMERFAPSGRSIDREGPLHTAGAPARSVKGWISVPGC